MSIYITMFYKMYLKLQHELTTQYNTLLQRKKRIYTKVPN
ncbi:hypothetical protein HMPREF9018_0373 [Prevotella amnii CRIS 21A-A]|uniref:Uncharacterized protein n=1 Tax=Prevotella amnii CRIS 21A-A TaxID=679191 RepID=E1GXU8_9BACT|nr:hypothetical protein HMPREF9018_0373 [Prevotella amnii CRIS 21A-A]